jgi:FAD/FMN-containing dehydrogenase
VADPFDRPYPAYLVVEVAATADPTGDLAAAVGRLDEVLDAAVATSEARREELWRLRELHTEALAAVGPPRKYDVTVPLGALDPFVAEARELVEAVPGHTCHHFGHLGDGNVHLNVLGPDAEDLDGDVYRLVAAHGGSISAEHGIGRLKRPWLHLSRSPAEVAAMRAVKAALDPAGLLNPGVLLPD